MMATLVDAGMPPSSVAPVSGGAPVALPVAASATAPSTLAMPGASPGASDALLRLTWPTRDVIMLTGATVAIHGFTSGSNGSTSVKVALQHESGASWQANGSLGPLMWHDAPIVDAAGHWRLLFRPTTPGVYTLRAVATDGLGRSASAGTTFTVRGASQALPPAAPVPAPAPVAPPTSLQVVESAGGVSLLKDAAGIAYVQAAGGQPVAVSRADSYWRGLVPLTRDGATLRAAERDAQGRLRVLDVSTYGRFAWILDASGRFVGEEKYEPAALPAAETLFSVDLDGNGIVGAPVRIPPAATPGPTPPAPTLTARDRTFWEPARGIGFAVGSQGALVDQARLEGALRQVASLGFTMIRTWGTDAYTGRILEAITRLNLPLKVQVGVYITNDSQARSQIDSALSIIQPYSRAVLGVSLGNEQIVDWNASNRLTVPQVLGHVQYFKSRSTLPVTYNFAGETFLPGASQWAQGLAGLVAALDYVNVHTYGGFFDNRTTAGWTPARQVEAVRSYETMLAARLGSLGLGDKPIVIGETGWQSTGYNPVVTNPAQAKAYYEAISRYVYGPTTRFDSMFYFNLTDEAWKGGDNFWGLFAEGDRAAIGPAKFTVQPLPALLGGGTPATPPDAPVPPPPPTPAVGSFPLTLVNSTGGTYADSRIYVTIIGQATPGVWSWVDAAGAVRPLNHLDANLPNRLVKSGVNYANMSFTIADAANLRLPPSLQGARIFVSLGQPLFIGISPDDRGYAGPDPANPTDPNYGTLFDWYEMTYVYGQVPFGGNTTQVDQFGLPLKVTVEQAGSGYSSTRGLTQSRAQVFASLGAQLPAEYQPLVVRDAAGNPLRMLAPRTQTPGALSTWFDGPVNDFWSKYRSQTFVWKGPGYTVTGRIDANSTFACTISSGGAEQRFVMRKPTTQEIFACSGPFAGSGLQGAFLAELSAAFNRGVAATPERWGDVAAYYPASGRSNAFAKAFHDLGIGRYAYGFPYDDVTDQSSVQILANAQPPSRLTIAVGG